MKVFKGTILGSRSARRTFIALFVSMLLLIGAALSAFGMYLLYGRYPVSQNSLAVKAIKAVMIAQALPIDKLPMLSRSLSQKGVSVRMDLQPRPGSQIIQLTDPASIRRYIFQHSYDFLLSVPLANGQWLNIHGHRIRSAWISAGALVSGIVLFFAFFMVCVWTVKRLAWPWDAFTKAARRFGVDMDAPALALSGPREMQVVIKAFNEMQARIRRLMHDRTQMLAAISHDLRTPITRLQLRAEYLEGTGQYDKTIADLNEMEKMISSILSFARDSSSKEPMERFDLNALLEVMCDDMEDVGQPVSFEAKAGSRVAYFGRFTALKRAFTNIIENAIKYGLKARVSLKRTEDGFLQVVVEDEGPGIPEHQMENVFSPFYRLDSSRSLTQSGTGLGMATARDIIRGHGGEIKLYNLHGRGLRVVVTLPMRDES